MTARASWSSISVMRYTLLAALLLALLLVLVSCAAMQPREDADEDARRPAATVKPVVIVADFENRAGFSGRWNLPAELADMLVARLLSTGKVTVLERAHLQEVMQEIARQGSTFSREEGRIKPGGLKNARYLIRGVVTDFSVANDSSGWFGVPHVTVKGGRSEAKVALTLTISDIRSGEIISSAQTTGLATQSFMGASVDYSVVSFGGETFMKTPLGSATDKAVRKAAARVLNDLPPETWQARVAESGPDGVIVNGGENVGIRADDTFVVRREGRVVTDPTTGDVIETLPGPIMGRIQVKSVGPSSARAALIEGAAERGDYLEAVAEH